MKVRLPNGDLVEVPNDAVLDDDGSPLSIPAPQQGRVFSEDDVARIRQEEKDKLYSALNESREELKGLREQVGSLTAAEQRRAAELQKEQERLEAEARAAEEQDMDARSLIERSRSEWEQQLNQVNQTWEQRFQESEQQRLAAEAQAAKEREFGELRDYTLAQVAAHENEIAPQLRGWITGNSQAEVDAAIARAIETTNQIAAEMAEAFGGQQVPGQQVAVPQAPALPGTRVTGGPSNTDPAAGGQQTLTAEQIKNMPMDQWAKIRAQAGIGGQSNNRGLFG